MRKFNPTGNLVVLQPIPHNTQTDSGLFLTDKHKQDQQLWTVLCVGPGRLSKKGIRVPVELNSGDKVVTAGIPNTRHTWDDGVVLMDAQEILAKY